MLQATQRNRNPFVSFTSIAFSSLCGSWHGNGNVPSQALLQAPEILKKASLRPGQVSSLLAFLPQWETNRLLVSLDCGVPSARSSRLSDFKLRDVDLKELRHLFAPYNLSKQADLVGFFLFMEYRDTCAGSLLLLNSSCVLIGLSLNICISYILVWDFSLR